MDLTSVTAWLEKFGPPLLAALLAAVASLTSAMLVPWFQERRRAKREHLDAIKAQVLRPVQEDLERFYLPLLQGKLGPVVSTYVVIPADGSLSQAPNTWRWELSPRQDIGAEPLPFLGGGQRRPQPNGELYEDAKRRHYRKMIRRLEAVKGEVERYTASWVPHAAHLSKAIVERSGLPIVTADLSKTNSPCVDAHGLAQLSRFDAMRDSK